MRTRNMNHASGCAGRNGIRVESWRGCCRASTGFKTAMPFGRRKPRDLPALQQEESK